MCGLIQEQNDMFVEAHELLIYNLEEKLDKNNQEFLPREVAYAHLQMATDEDFGYDGDAWRKWFEENDLDVAYKGIKKYDIE